MDNLNPWRRTAGGWEKLEEIITPNFQNLMKSLIHKSKKAQKTPKTKTWRELYQSNSQSNWEEKNNNNEKTSNTIDML